MARADPYQRRSKRRGRKAIDARGADAKELGLKSVKRDGSGQIIEGRDVATGERVKNPYRRDGIQRFKDAQKNRDNSGGGPEPEKGSIEWVRHNAGRGQPQRRAGGPYAQDTGQPKRASPFARKEDTPGTPEKKSRDSKLAKVDSRLLSQRKEVMRRNRMTESQRQSEDNRKARDIEKAKTEQAKAEEAKTKEAEKQQEQVDSAYLKQKGLRESEVMEWREMPDGTRRAIVEPKELGAMPHPETGEPVIGMRDEFGEISYQDPLESGKYQTNAEGDRIVIINGRHSIVDDNVAADQSRQDRLQLEELRRDRSLVSTRRSIASSEAEAASRALSQTKADLNDYKRKIQEESGLSSSYAADRKKLKEKLAKDPEYKRMLGAIDAANAEKKRRDSERLSADRSYAEASEKVLRMASIALPLSEAKANPTYASEGATVAQKSIDEQQFRRKFGVGGREFAKEGGAEKAVEGAAKAVVEKARKKPVEGDTPPQDLADVAAAGIALSDGGSAEEARLGVWRDIVKQAPDLAMEIAGVPTVARDFLKDLEANKGAGAKAPPFALPTGDLQPKKPLAESLADIDEWAAQDPSRAQQSDVWKRDLAEAEIRNAVPGVRDRLRRSLGREPSPEEVWEDMSPEGPMVVDGIHGIWASLDRGVSRLKSRFTGVISAIDSGRALEVKREADALFKTFEDKVGDPEKYEEYREDYERWAELNEEHQRLRTMSEIGGEITAEELARGSSYPISKALKEYEESENLSDFFSGDGSTKRTMGLIGAAVAQTLPDIAATIGAGVVTGGAGAGLTGLSTEFMDSYLGKIEEVAQNRGLDITDPDQLQQVVDDPTVRIAAQEFATKRGATIGAIDALTFKVGGAVVKGMKSLAAKSGGKIQKVAGSRLLGASVATVGGGLSEGSGEAVAQLITQGKIDPKEVVLEAIAGAPIAAGGALASTVSRAGAQSSSGRRESDLPGLSVPEERQGEIRLPKPSDPIVLRQKKSLSFIASREALKEVRSSRAASSFEGGMDDIQALDSERSLESRASELAPQAVGLDPQTAAKIASSVSLDFDAGVIADRISEGGATFTGAAELGAILKESGAIPAVDVQRASREMGTAGIGDPDSQDLVYDFLIGSKALDDLEAGTIAEEMQVPLVEAGVAEVHEDGSVKIREEAVALYPEQTRKRLSSKRGEVFEGSDPEFRGDVANLSERGAQRIDDIAKALSQQEKLPSGRPPKKEVTPPPNIPAGSASPVPAQETGARVKDKPKREPDSQEIATESDQEVAAREAREKRVAEVKSQKRGVLAAEESRQASQSAVSQPRVRGRERNKKGDDPRWKLDRQRGDQIALMSKSESRAADLSGEPTGALQGALETMADTGKSDPDTKFRIEQELDRRRLENDIEADFEKFESGGQESRQEKGSRRALRKKLRDGVALTAEESAAVDGSDIASLSAKALNSLDPKKVDGSALQDAIEILGFSDAKGAPNKRRVIQKKIDSRARGKGVASPLKKIAGIASENMFNNKVAEVVWDVSGC